MELQTRNVNTAFKRLVEYFNGQRDVLREPPVVRNESRNGPVLRIDEPVLITYERPLERVLLFPERDANCFFNLYEALWMLAGRNDVAPLAYYAKNIANYSDDGETLNGAYGYRWRNYYTKPEGTASSWSNDEQREVHWHHKNSQMVDQLDILVAHLKADPTSRRAVLQMWNVEDDLLKIGLGESTSRDVCCNTSVMFSIREKSLNLDGTLTIDVLDTTVTNRSNDMIWGTVGADFTCFSFLQEYVAARLSVKVGRYHHFSNNLHVYTESNSGFHPDKWLAELAPNEYPTSIVPLVRDPEVFEKELQSIVGNAYGPGVVGTVGMSNYFEPFFQTVAKPMFCAFALHKEQQYSSALAWCNRIEAADWKTAATTWIQRRMNKKGAAV